VGGQEVEWKRDGQDGWPDRWAEKEGVAAECWIG
jgi:hypothetical protein